MIAPTATCVITQEYSSTALVSLHSRKKKYGAFKKMFLLQFFF
jgi:hypothetical protein